MSTENPINVSVDGHVGIIELNRPHKFNCLAIESHEFILQTLARWRADRQVRSILVCSTGKHFCTGADLDSVQRFREDASQLAQFIHKGHAALRALENSGVPTVAAVQGMCLAGGLELMLACDVAFAAADALLGDQHAQFGLIPGWGASQRLPRIVGMRRAMDLFYTARRIDAATAQDWGLVNHVCPPETLRQQALDYCHSLTRRSASGLATMKRLAYGGIDMTLDQGLSMEEDVALNALRGADATEGLQAFMERREPVFEK
ncbi:MAG: enoyl-CoA hydratase/isomerase family protein [Burkholderiaceae bacterium]|nr:enoyl-CoA hydratase/isomerase family protein [Burkholderiaceae bacterium]